MEGETKSKLLRVLMDAIPIVKVVLRTNGSRVRIPDHLRACDLPVTVFDIGHGLARPIRDFECDAKGIRGTLSFNGQPFFCDVPWPAIVGAIEPNGGAAIQFGSSEQQSEPERHRGGLRVV